MSIDKALKLKSEHWIFGPGSIGTVFLSNLAIKGKNFRVFGAKSESKEFVLNGLYPKSIHTKVEVRTVKNTVAQVENLYCYFCVPAKQLKSVFEDVAELLKNLEVDSMYLFFCSNGVVVEPIKKFLSGLQSRTCIFAYRALLYFGARRVVDTPQMTEVNFNGGKLIVYSAIGGSQNQRCEEFENCHDMFQWVLSGDIESNERQKLFINFMLALFIGPRKIENGKFFEYISPKSYQILLGAFCEAAKLDTKQLDQLFRKTLIETSSNVNSYSLAWANKNKESVVELINDFTSITDFYWNDKNKKTQFNIKQVISDCLKSHGGGGFL